MTEHSPGTPPAGQRATAAAREVGGQAVQAGGHVTQTVKEQGREVAAEATHQARNLYGQARGQLTSQAGAQQRRAVGGLRSLAGEMQSMAEQGGQSGPVTGVARQVATRTHDVAGWLEQRQPGDLINEVRGYARRNPGVFLAGAALLGVLAGRLVRNVATADAEPQDAAGDRSLRGPAESNGYDNGRTGPPAAMSVPSGTSPVWSAPTNPGSGPAVTETDPLPGVPSVGARR